MPSDEIDLREHLDEEQLEDLEGILDDIEAIEEGEVVASVLQYNNSDVVLAHPIAVKSDILEKLRENPDKVVEEREG